MGSIPRLSCTGVRQKWGKTQAAAVCPAVSVEELCHVPRPEHQRNLAPAGTYRDSVLVVAPKSFLYRRRAAQSLSSSKRVTPATVKFPPLDKDIVKVMEIAIMLGESC